MKTKYIDLNLDAGEDLELEQSLYPLVSSLNIACGGHTGSRQSMRTVLARCENLKLHFGAHPSFPDQENFGRQVPSISRTDLEHSLKSQIGDLISVFDDSGISLSHIKPHGALYNLAAQHPDWMAWTSDLLAQFGVPIVGLGGSLQETYCRKNKIPFLRESFADRNYRPDGSLVPRSQPEALILDPQVAAIHAVKLAPNCDTICIHSDTPGALQIARSVRQALRNEGYSIRGCQS